jgi:hypothetical protein
MAVEAKSLSPVRSDCEGYVATLQILMIFCGVGMPLFVVPRSQRLDIY